MKKQILLTAFTILLTACSLIQAAPSDDHLTKALTGMIDALNKDDVAKREAFLKKYYVNADSASALERWQGHLVRYSEMLGNIKIRTIDLSDKAQPRALIQTSSPRSMSEFENFFLNMDQNKPEKFFSMGLEPGLNPEITAIDRPLTNEEIRRFTKEYIQSLVDKDLFSGAVSLAKDGIPFYEDVYGKADLRWGVDNKLDTKFNLGSMNKMFTGVAICQLVEQGKLSFDDKINKYLDTLPNDELANNITVHQLLTHTSGMVSYWEAMANMDWTALRSVKDFADLNLNDKLSFEPGTEFQYSNSGPLYLGLIIEKITGMDYHDYIREHVSKPAGMENTDCYHVDAVIPNLAQGYAWDPETETHWANIFQHSARGSAAGGGFSTVVDLQRFAKALYDGTLLSKEMLETYTTGKIEMGPNDKYAYLIGDELWNGHRAVGHGGGAPGINADLKIFPDLGYTIAVMVNYDEAATAVSQFVTQLITHNREVPE